jgi:hypothetical protein
VGSWGAIGTLIVAIIGAFTGGDGSVLGILGILLAVATLYFTRFGRVWDNLAGFPKLIAYPCVAFGIFMGVGAIFAVVYGFYLGMGSGRTDRA